MLTVTRWYGPSSDKPIPAVLYMQAYRRRIALDSMVHPDVKFIIIIIIGFRKGFRRKSNNYA